MFGFPALSVVGKAGLLLLKPLGRLSETNIPFYKSYLVEYIVIADTRDDILDRFRLKTSSTVISSAIFNSGKLIIAEVIK